MTQIAGVRMRILAKTSRVEFRFEVISVKGQHRCHPSVSNPCGEREKIQSCPDPPFEACAEETSWALLETGRIRRDERIPYVVEREACNELKWRTLRKSRGQERQTKI